MRRDKIKAKALLFCILGLAAASGAAAASLGAPDAPDFSGRWILSAKRSDFAGEVPPMSKLQKVEQKGLELTVTIDEIGERGAVHGVAHYATDGRDAVNNVQGHLLTSSIGWEGAVMIMRTWGKYGDTDIMLIDRWSLSPDGKTLTMARQFQGHGRTIDQLLVFDRS